nr:MAG TPA: hypothetical protein [Inoviridae sp.]
MLLLLLVSNHYLLSNLLILDNMSYLLPLFCLFF